MTLSSSGCTICCIDGVCTMPGAKWHGTPGGYNNHICRCRPCTDAWAEHHRTGTAAAAKKRYNTKLLLRGRVLGHGLNGPLRIVTYKPRKGAGYSRPETEEGK